MRHLLMGLACAAMVMGSQAFAQNTAKEKTKQDRTAKRQQTQNQKGQQQTVRGTVVGVTSVGEALVDPQTNSAVMVEKDYLTVLGNAAGQRGQGNRTRDNADRGNQAENNQADNDQQRQNLYLIAITPQTKVHKQMGRRAADRDATDKAQDQNEQQSRQNFEQLEIGDRVMVRFSSTERLHAKSDSKEGKERTTGFRGNPSTQKHGRDRIFVGEASEIAIMSTPGNQRGQNRERQNNRSNQ